MSADPIIKFLLCQWIASFGVPARITSHCGRHLDSALAGSPLAISCLNLEKQCKYGASLDSFNIYSEAFQRVGTRFHPFVPYLANTTVGGQFLVVKRVNTFFTLLVGGREINTSIDGVKPAFILDNNSIDIFVLYVTGDWCFVYKVNLSWNRRTCKVVNKKGFVSIYLFFIQFIHNLLKLVILDYLLQLSPSLKTVFVTLLK